MKNWLKLNEAGCERAQSDLLKLQELLDEPEHSDKFDVIRNMIKLRVQTLLAVIHIGFEKADNANESYLSQSFFEMQAIGYDIRVWASSVLKWINDNIRKDCRSDEFGDEEGNDKNDNEPSSPNSGGGAYKSRIVAPTLHSCRDKPTTALVL